MMDMLVYDKGDGGNVIGSAPITIACSGPFGLIEGRNDAVRMFLDGGSHEWLMWIDTDMGFRPDSLDRLLAAADPVERPVVGGLCFALRFTKSDGYNGHLVQPVPTLFNLLEVGGVPLFVNQSVYEPGKLNRVAGTGSAFILIHRSVLEEIREKCGDEWYSPLSIPGGKPISEDLSFCARVTGVGQPIFVHTGIETTHHKQIWVDSRYYVMPESDPIFDTTTSQA